VELGVSYIYLAMNNNRREPSCLNDVNYKHLKCKSDGSFTLILTENPISDMCVAQKSKEEAEQILRSWIDEENQNPERDPEGNAMIQSYVSLSYVDKIERPR
jgi:hypothetical protein